MYFSRCTRRREARRAEASSSANGEPGPPRGGDDATELAEALPKLFREKRRDSFWNPPEPSSASARERGRSWSEDSLASSLEPRRASRRSASARLERALRGAESFSSPQLAPRGAFESGAFSSKPAALFRRRSAVAGEVKSFRPSERVGHDRARDDPGASGDGERE